jgi:DNA-binding NtrC family response regulator
MARPVILVVDDDPGVRESFRLILEDHYDVVDVPDGPSALEVVRASPMDLVLLDIRLPGMDGIEVLERIKAIDDHLTKPFEEDELLPLASRALERRTLEREVALLRSELARTHDLDEIVGKHPVMEKLHGLIAQVARTSTTVLITGESGTGKELVARAIHRHGPPAA